MMGVVLISTQKSADRFIIGVNRLTPNAFHARTRHERLLADILQRDSGAVVKGRLVVFHRVGQRAGVAGIERNVRDEAVRDRACHPGRAVHFVRRDSAPLLPWRKEVSRPTRYMR
jgi:hypothetical protein